MMSTNDIFDRKNEIMESMNLDLMIPLTEGIGSNIAGFFKKLKKVVVDFFKRLIQGFRNFRDRLFNRGGGSSSNNNDNKKSKETEEERKKREREQEEYRKKSEEAKRKWQERERAKYQDSNSKNGHGFNEDEIIRKAKSSNIKLPKPIQNPKSYSNCSSVFDSILNDAKDIAERFKNVKDLEVFKKNILNSLFNIGNETMIPKWIKGILREKKKIIRISDVNFNAYFEYFNSKRIISDLKKQENNITQNINNAERESGNIDINQFKYVLQVQLKATQSIIKEIQFIMSECVVLVNKLKNA